MEEDRVVATGKEDAMIDTVGPPPADTWVQRSTEIRITLGEFCIATILFRAATLADLDWRRPCSIPEAGIQGELRSGVEIVYFSSLPATGPLPRFSFRKYGVRYVPSQFTRHYIDIRSTFQEYLSRFGAKSRKNLTRSVRLFAEASSGAVDFREYRRPDEMTVFYDLASQVTLKTYQHKLLKAGLLQTDDFRRKLFELADLDRVRGYILCHKEAPVAFAYCTAQNEVLTYQTIGYDPDFRQYSPGTVLLYHILKSVFSEQRFSIFDFGTGESFYKSFFGTGVASCAAVYYFGYTPKNLAFLALHSSATLVSAAAVKALSALRVKEFIKKALRRAG